MIGLPSPPQSTTVIQKMCGWRGASIVRRSTKRWRSLFPIRFRPDSRDTNSGILSPLEPSPEILAHLQSAIVHQKHAHEECFGPISPAASRPAERHPGKSLRLEFVFVERQRPDAARDRSSRSHPEKPAFAPTQRIRRFPTERESVHHCR